MHSDRRLENRNNHVEKTLALTLFPEQNWIQYVIFGKKVSGDKLTANKNKPVCLEHRMSIKIRFALAKWTSCAESSK